MTKIFTYHNLSELMWKLFISNGGYIQPFVGVMSQNEGICNEVEAGNVAALGRKSLAVFRKYAASSSRSLTWNTSVTTDCSTQLEMRPSVCICRWNPFINIQCVRDAVNNG